MFYPSEITNEEFRLKKFLDFDKYKKIIYNNLYLDDFHIVIKMCLITNNYPNEELRIEKFDLTKYSFLLSYD